jgi:hypothetical protein
MASGYSSRPCSSAQTERASSVDDPVGRILRGVKKKNAMRSTALVRSMEPRSGPRRKEAHPFAQPANLAHESAASAAPMALTSSRGARAGGRGLTAAEQRVALFHSPGENLQPVCARLSKGAGAWNRVTSNGITKGDPMRL